VGSASGAEQLGELRLVAELGTASLRFIGEADGSSAASCTAAALKRASVEAAKPARMWQRRGRGGDAAMGGTAWCWWQCAVPS